MTFGRRRFFAFILGCISLLTAKVGVVQADPRAINACDIGTALSAGEREFLLSKLRISMAGQKILNEFKKKYGALSRMVIQWDSVSYSQVTSPSGIVNRAPAASEALGSVVCVHLAHKLPEIEHVADLAHELTHATRLSLKVLRGNVKDAAAFVHARLSSAGGEADAFAVECRVKRELLQEWDRLCAPYADRNGKDIDVTRVIRDLYNGHLSASLTGEAYPVMLKRQYHALNSGRKPAGN